MTDSKITHQMFISGKVKDVQAQMSILCEQFPNGTIKDVCDAYGLECVVLK